MRMSRRSLRLALPWVLTLLASWFIAATAAAQMTNGCGSGWNRYLVPDGLKIIGCNFKPACDAHDICYGRCTGFKPGEAPAQCEYLRCLSGGDLVGKPICDSVPFRDQQLAARERQVRCDANFMIDITQTNPGNARCDFFSGLYPFAVRVLGAKNFLGMDTLDEVAMSKADRQRYVDAVNELLATWPDERLSDLTRQIRAGDPPFDLTKPIEFDPKQGLRNRPPSDQ